MSNHTNYRRGFHRIFWCLTVAWVLFLTVLAPLYLQWHQQTVADADHAYAYANCHDEGCFDLADQNRNARVGARSLTKFWVWDVGLWKFQLVAIIVLPAFVYGFARLVRWIGQGFVKQEETLKGGTIYAHVDNRNHR